MGTIFGRGINILVLLYTYLWVLFGRSIAPLNWLDWLLNSFFGASPTWLTVASAAMRNGNAEGTAWALVCIAAIIIVIHGTFINRGNLYILTFVTLLLLCSVQISGNLWGTYLSYLGLTLIPVAIAFIRCWLQKGGSIWASFENVEDWWFSWMMGPAIHLGLATVGLWVIFYSVLGNEYLPLDPESSR